MKTSRMIMIAACFLVVLSTVSAVAPARAGEYVAFSLGVAQKQIEAAGRADWRREGPAVFALGVSRRSVGWPTTARRETRSWWGSATPKGRS